MTLDLTNPDAAYDGVAAAKATADQAFLAAIADPANAYRVVLAAWQAAALARVAAPLDDVLRDAEKTAWQTLGDTRAAYQTAVTAAKQARTLAIKTALGG